MSSVREMIKDMEHKRVNEQRFVIDALKHTNDLLPEMHICAKTIGLFAYLTICGKNDFDMVKASILSFALNSDIHPQEYIIVSDGTWNQKEGEEFFCNFVSPLKFVLWSECVDDIIGTYPEIGIWSQKQVWGRKLAAIISFSTKSAVLYSDSDVLWFNTPFTIEELNTIEVKISVDNDYFYDKECIKKLGLEHVYSMDYPINCGVIFIRDFNSIITPNARACMKYEATNPGNFSEQTVFAMINMTHNNVWLPNQIKVDISDMISDFDATSCVTNNMIARHYVWRLKWIFWKDFLTMHINNLKLMLYQ